ncbi:unnamed protein product [Coffea canephora]|uniref:DH200=94 genomic scaffold, scaffold_1253 n=1 Tax=Coffea canephora TaxID=49390 RepID=A0A068VIR0_COFCA|nr:unnamed protein product [Coffea canephora]
MKKADLSSFRPPSLAAAGPIFPRGKNIIKTTISRPKTSSIKNSIDNNEKTTSVEEIRVCTNRTCRRQGSLDILQILSGIAPPSVSVNSCGCLGRCGAGPNVVVLPQGAFVGHCSTPAKAARLMVSLVCGFHRNDKDFERSSMECLEAFALRKRAEDEMEKGNLDGALLFLSQAIELKPFGGVHITYKTRSTARLAMGNICEALDDAKEALTLAPNYPEGYICQGDALMAMDQIDAAEKSYAMALELEPSLRRSKSFKARIAALQERLFPANSA